MKTILEISNHPFYIGPVLESNNTLPESLPLKIGIHPKYSIPRLILTYDIKKALNDMYDLGSFVSTPLGESNLASVRMNEFSQKLISVMGGVISGKKILEIGCGNGKLLNELKKMGAIVKGIEIGPQADIVKNKYGIEVFKEPLSKISLDDQFDCIISYGCLEHIDDLEAFFESSRLSLSNNGLFFHSVPNSELSFSMFNLDHLLHQHINYFTSKNAVKLFNSQGFKNSSFSISENKNELMVWGFYSKKNFIDWPLQMQEEELNNLIKYKVGLESKSKKIKLRLNKLIKEGKSIGFYAGGFEYGFHLKNNKLVRYFDSDEYKHGRKWLKSLPNIEPQKNLLEKKLDKIIVCKPHYYKKIYDSLVEIGVDASSIINIEDLK